MKHHGFNILLLQETKVKCNQVETHEGYFGYFSSKVRSGDRDKADYLKTKGKQIPPELRHKITEHRGVALVLDPIMQA